jgi:predicted esterase
MIQHALQPPIPFLSHAPVIDGVLTPDKAQLPARRFTHTFKMDPGNPDFDLCYRLAYGTDYLYLYIQVDAETFICRDRGFQNGDGFVLTLAKPQPENAPSPQFTMLGFWPQEDVEQPFARLLWGRNGDYPFIPLTSDTQFVVKANAVVGRAGKVGFELCLPWRVSFPYHPWLGDIGFDLFFVKAVGEGQSNIYTAFLDDLSKITLDATLYARLNFAPPVLDRDIQYALTMDRNAEQGQAISVQVAALAAQATELPLVFELDSGEGERLDTQHFKFDCPVGISRHTCDLDTARLIAGGYRVRWHVQGREAEDEMGFTLLPPFDPQDVKRRLVQARPCLDADSYHSLLFQVEMLAGQKARLSPDLTCASLRVEMARCLDLIGQAENGVDALAHRTGSLRRAFRSDVDGTLQPYTVHLPAGFDPARTYPLLVFLHGSERDDRALAEHLGYVTTDDFIMLAPKGRGTSNAYTVDHAQEDIQEAVADVCRHYPIDRSNVVLAGFSMGGYGVYRTHYETPGAYKALAVFCGIPDLANERVGPEGHPDFLRKEYLAPFVGMPMFVFHGTADRNAPFEKTVQAVGKLEAVGAHVKFVAQEGTGHGAPHPEYVAQYHRWLEAVIETKGPS